MESLAQDRSATYSPSVQEYFNPNEWPVEIHENQTPDEGRSRLSFPGSSRPLSHASTSSHPAGKDITYPPSPPNPAIESLTSAQVQDQSAPGPPDDPYPYSHHGKLWNTIFMITTCMAQFLAQAQFGAVLIPLVEIGKWLGTTDPGELSWMAASYGLTVGMFLVASGRLGDLYGPKLLLSLGYVVMIVSNLASGFCTSRVPFDVCRALSGLGAALCLPNAAAMLGRTFPPGTMRYIGFSILGALAPIGWWCGGAIASAISIRINPAWVWWFLALLSLAALLMTLIILPPDSPAHPLHHPFGLGFPFEKRQFDILGTLLLCTSIGLFNFSWNQSTVTGWQEAYVPVLLGVSIISFVAFYLWEKKMGRGALIPTEVLTKSSLLVYLSLWLGWMSLGTFLLYTSFLNIRGVDNALNVALEFLPLAPLGCIAALIVPSLIIRLPGHVIFFGAMIAFLSGNITASVQPAHGSYWGSTFISEILVIWGPDLSFATGSLIVSNSVDREFQGIAGGMVSMITNYSLSIGLGMAGTVERYVQGSNGNYNNLLDGYRAAFYFATGLSLLATFVVGGFVRMEKQAHYRE